jgi:hypothetical protein
MSSTALGGAVITLAGVSAVMFAGVEVQELGYASSHPHAFGPARVIAWACGGGLLLSTALCLLALAVARFERYNRRGRQALLVRGRLRRPERHAPPLESAE